MKLLIAISLLLIFPSCLVASDWRQQDTYRELAFASLVIIDWKQTLNISNSNGVYYESNPFLGKNPSNRTVNLYMPIMTGSHVLISYLLPLKYRAAWQYITIGMEAGTVMYNYNIGLGFLF